MKSKPRSPTLRRRAAGWTLRGGFLLALGVLAYFGLELADRALMDRLAGGPAATELTVIASPPPEAVQAPAQLANSDGPGNAYVRRAALAIESHGSIAVRYEQHGWVDSAPAESTGRYLQLGAGGSRQFLLEQVGQLAGAPTRLLSVSDSRFLWTDLAWGNPANPERSVTRVDLRKVRNALTRGDDDAVEAPPRNDPGLWSRFGGLPMLLSGLDRAFTFGQPRAMELRGQRVAAIVGRWRPERAAEITGDPAAPLPPRAPGHVVIALSETTLFPLLVEYRDQRDPLAAPGLHDDALLTSSRRPLLKIDLGDPTFNERLDPGLFTYRPVDDRWSDQTDRELRIATPPGGSLLR